ncbi:MAG: transposase [Chloroflexi bacterium]|nr:transposase [Chloroflexota bacterium]
MTLGFLFALKGVSERAFYRWIVQDYSDLFPTLPDRTRLFRLFKVHQDWTKRFMAEPTVLGIAGTYGIELIHPIPEGRSEQQIGKKGQSKHRWIVGGKLGFVLNQFGLVADWDCDTANVSDRTFQPPIEQFNEIMIVLVDHGFHAQAGDPPNMKICDRGMWNTRMLIETVLSLLTLVSHFKKVSIASGHTSEHGSLLRWRCSTCSCNGMGCSRIKTN